MVDSEMIGSGSSSNQGWREPHAHSYLRPIVLDLCARHKAKRILCMGRRNGTLCHDLQDAGYAVAREAGGHGMASPTERDLAGNLSKWEIHEGPHAPEAEATGFDVALSTEADDLLFKPSALLQLAARKLRHDGILMILMPDHPGYLKSFFFTTFQPWRNRYSPSGDESQIKTWSRESLKPLLESHGFTMLETIGVRHPSSPRKTMIIVARKVGELNKVATRNATGDDSLR